MFMVNEFYLINTVSMGSIICDHDWTYAMRGRVSYSGQYTQDRTCVRCGRSERWMRKAACVSAADKRAARAAAARRIANG
jgi:hypothetical protein